MAAIDDVWLAALTRDEDDAGSKNQFNLTVNIDGADVFGHDFRPRLESAGPGGHRAPRRAGRPGRGQAARRPSIPTS